MVGWDKRNAACGNVGPMRSAHGVCLLLCVAGTALRLSRPTSNLEKRRSLAKFRDRLQDGIFVLFVAIENLEARLKNQCFGPFCPGSEPPRLAIRINVDPFFWFWAYPSTREVRPTTTTQNTWQLNTQARREKHATHSDHLHLELTYRHRHRDAPVAIGQQLAAGRQPGHGRPGGGRQSGERRPPRCSRHRQPVRRSRPRSRPISTSTMPPTAASCTSTRGASRSIAFSTWHERPRAWAPAPCSTSWGISSRTIMWWMVRGTSWSPFQPITPTKPSWLEKTWPKTSPS